jgi:hypothetical protein
LQKQIPRRARDDSWSVGAGNDSQDALPARRAYGTSVRVLWLAALAALAMAGFGGLFSYAQDAPLDASEISRDLLYLAPSRVEYHAAGATGSYAFAGNRFAYIAPRDGREWSIVPITAPAAKSHEKQRVFAVEADGGKTLSPYELVGASDDDRATLALRKKGESDPLVMATLWDRDQLAEAWLPELRKEKHGLTLDGLRQDLEVADPEVRAMAIYPANNQPILVAVGQSAGEGELGLSTIVKFEPDTRDVKVYHMPGALTCEVSAVGANQNPQGVATVWLGMRAVREGAIAPCGAGGLSKLDVQTRQVTPAAGGGAAGKSLPLGSIVTVFGPGEQNSLVMASDAGICTLVKNSENDWSCRRFVPTATLHEAVPVANRPGDKPYGQLKPGDYEVLWANQNFLEVVTADSYDAWLAADDFAEAAARNFDAEPYKLLNTASGGAAPIRPLAKPGGEPLNGALIYRAPLEKLTAPAGTPNGWVHVRARTGWIAWKNLDVAPKLVLVQK